MKLDIYEIIEGTDNNWPLVETIEAETAEECVLIAESKYNENYHYTNPY